MISFSVFNTKDILKISIKGNQHSAIHQFYFDSHPIMMVNIPKNASRSMSTVLRDQIGIGNDKGNEFFWFAIVRDPIKRFASAMKMLEGYKGLSADDLIDCLRYYPQNASQDFINQFIHFCPQRLVVQYHQSKFDVKFYSVENLEPLQKDLQKITGKEILIPHLHKTKNSKSVQRSIDRNIDFVNQFIKQDREWLRTLIIEK